MSSKDQQSQCKKIKLYNSEIMDLQFKIEKISQILKDFDEHSLQVDDKKKGSVASWRRSQYQFLQNFLRTSTTTNWLKNR
ncbi:hypothetical protein G3P38_002933 [Salmonella enterica]|nr:hypothetical protein [Salmonella enterica]EAT5049618.1 hypothetical protein [Salmonella enterica subsp. enterica]EBH8353860.1 hypothetical protein [Salmonella enterica subsp. diarizonae serovar 61:l,[v],[z13]:1,5,[7]]MBQ4987455.1 hypothetical protein [Salmonella enterica subsp. diarizonae serovar 61:l,v:1,5,7]MDW0124983.1 hypothetical protein [Salmonella enterica subsp. enterica serovar 61:l,v:1,5]HAA0737576.1 hypothetical protein [Salmonella enterica subsp. diarizonae]HBJ6634829.1 hypothe